MYFFAGIRKNRAIKSYVHRLGRDLATRYGKAKEYTPGQVVKTVQDCGYNWRHICYAHALYVSHKHFDKWHEEQGETCDYLAMREEIASNHFGGSAEALASSDLCSGGESSFSDGATSGD